VRKRCTSDIKTPAAHRLVRKAKRSLDRKKIDAICVEISAVQALDARTPDEILGYGEYGVPR
jgi:hypothetical protein